MASKQMVNNNGCSKRSSSSRERERDRDKKKSLLSGESGASSQCDTPPLIERDGHSLQGKFAGISPESVQIMAEQFMPDLVATEVCTNLAEDVSFRLKQLLHNLSVHSKQLKKNKVEVEDVNTVLKLMDAGPILGAGLPYWIPLGDPENLCIPNDPIVDVAEIAITPQVYSCVTPPSVTASWVLDTKNSGNGMSMSPTLLNYFHKISKAVLGNNFTLLRLALLDLRDNPVIGQIVANFLNLAILVLTEETLSTVMVPIKTAIHMQVLDMLAALCANVCCEDIDVEIQLQQLYPILITNVLGAGNLSEQMCRTILYLASAWPRFVYIGETIILEYLSQGVEQRLSGPLVESVVALGRQPLLTCLGPYLHTIDLLIHTSQSNYFLYGLPESMLKAADLLYQPYPLEFDKEFLYLDYTLYEMLGDSVIPRRKEIETEIPDTSQETSKPSSDYDSDPFMPKLFKKKQKLRVQKYFPIKKENLNREPVFDSFGPISPRRHYIHFNFAGCRSIQHVGPKKNIHTAFASAYSQRRPPSLDYKAHIGIANGLLLRFKYKLPKKHELTKFNTYIL